LIYTGGCNLRCAFCHNPGLVLHPEVYPDYPRSELLKTLEARRFFIDGVVVSGGEPTLARGLDVLLEQIRELGLLVKLDTNGLRPTVLEDLLRRKLIDYLAIDLKTAPARYAELHPQSVDVSALRASCRLAIEAADAYEFRTTCVPGLIEVEDIQALGEQIAGARLWVLQQYVPRRDLLGDAPLTARPSGDFIPLSQSAQTFVERVEGRGWDA
jgi:pyruvate formate lyase activating enzyme